MMKPLEEMTVKGEKKKFYRNFLKLMMIWGLLFIALIGYGVYSFFFDMNSLPTGEYLIEETSPDGKYTLKAYVTNGGATTSYAVRGELIFNESNKKTKNIYWNNREDTATITWTDDDTVEINGHLLDVPNDTFDFRHQ